MTEGSNTDKVPYLPTEETFADFYVQPNGSRQNTLTSAISPNVIKRKRKRRTPSLKKAVRRKARSPRKRKKPKTPRKKKKGGRRPAKKKGKKRGPKRKKGKSTKSSGRNLFSI